MEVKKRIILGYGYSTYWIMGTAVIANFAAFTGGFMVNQAHNGYLEIALELGLIGLTLFAIILIILIYRIFKLKSNLPLLFVVALVLLDWTEATLFTRVEISTVVFMSLYIETSIFYFNLKENLRS
jgi:O-antigen ligase